MLVPLGTAIFNSWEFSLGWKHKWFRMRRRAPHICILTFSHQGSALFLFKSLLLGILLRYFLSHNQQLPTGISGIHNMSRKWQKQTKVRTVAWDPLPPSFSLVWQSFSFPVTRLPSLQYGSNSRSVIISTLRSRSRHDWWQQKNHRFLFPSLPGGFFPPASFDRDVRKRRKVVFPRLCVLPLSPRGSIILLSFSFSSRPDPTLKYSTHPTQESYLNLKFWRVHKIWKGLDAADHMPSRGY